MKKIDDNIWVIESDFKFMGADFGNRMTIIRLKDGSLLLHSPIKVKESYISQIKELGSVSYLITPNYFHGMHIADWQEYFPNATHYAPLEDKKTQSLSTLNTDLNDKNISVIPMQGLPKVNEYAFIHHPSQTLIFTDLAFNIGSNVSWWTKVFFSLNGAYNTFGPTRLMKSFLTDPQALESSMDNILRYDIHRVIVSHGHILNEDAKHTLQRAFQPLYAKKEAKKSRILALSKCG